MTTMEIASLIAFAVVGVIGVIVFAICLNRRMSGGYKSHNRGIRDSGRPGVYKEWILPSNLRHFARGRPSSFRRRQILSNSWLGGA